MAIYSAVTPAPLAELALTAGRFVNLMNQKAGMLGMTGLI